MSSQTIDPPRMLLEPEDQYIIRRSSVNLICVVESASKVLFKCNGRWLGGGTLQSHKRTLDKKTGMITTKLVMKVTRFHVNTFFAPHKYWCKCVSWNSAGKTISKKARIQIAYFHRSFKAEPLGGNYVVGDVINLTCVPPSGIPSPTVYWLKNGYALVPTSESNYMQTEDGSLILRIQDPSDSGNYTCVAKNVVSKRKSHSALIVVSVKGNWSSWSNWSVCSAKCGIGESWRTRTCSNQPPKNGGAECEGVSSQTRACFNLCPVDGAWTDWSSWSACSTSCYERRRRFCSKPSPRNTGQYCSGFDLESRNCTRGLCSERGLVSDADPVTAYNCILAVLCLLIVLLTAAFIFQKRKNRKKDSINVHNIPCSAHCDSNLSPSLHHVYNIPFCSMQQFCNDHFSHDQHHHPTNHRLDEKLHHKLSKPYLDFYNNQRPNLNSEMVKKALYCSHQWNRNEDHIIFDNKTQKGNHPQNDTFAVLPKYNCSMQDTTDGSQNERRKSTII